MGIENESGGGQGTVLSGATTDTNAIWSPILIRTPPSSLDAMPLELPSTVRTVFLRGVGGRAYLRFGSSNTVVAHVNGTLVSGDSDVTDSGATQVVTKNSTFGLSCSVVGTITVTSINASGGYTVMSSVDLFSSDGFIAIPANSPVPSAVWLSESSNGITISVNATAAGEISTFPVATAGTISIGNVGSFDYNLYQVGAQEPWIEFKVPRGLASSPLDPVYLWIRNKYTSVGRILVVRS
jgi:hypothetical protein